MRGSRRGVIRRRSIVLTAAFGAGLPTVTTTLAALTPDADNVLTASDRTGTLTIKTLTLQAQNQDVNLLQDAGTTLTLNADRLAKTGPFNSSISGGQLTSGPDDVIVADVNGDGGVLTVSSALAGPALALVKSGAGTLSLTSTDTVNNSIGGGIFVNQGTVQIFSDLNLGANAGNSNSVTLDGGALRISANVSFSPSRTLAVDQNGGTLLVDAGATATLAASNQLVAGSSAAGQLIKDGLGTLVISSSNSFNGPVSVNAGTLDLRHPNALGSPPAPRSTITLNGGSQLVLRSDGPFPANFGSDVVVTGNAAIGLGTISVPNPPGPDVRIQLGSLTIGSPTGATLSVQTVGGANRSLEFTGTTRIQGDAVIANTADVRLGGQVTGSGSLTKTGAGTLSLSGFAPNTYANLTKVIAGTLSLDKQSGNIAVPGDLLVQGGTVVLNAANQIASTSNVTLDSGTTARPGRASTTTPALLANGFGNTISSLTNVDGELHTQGGVLTVTSSAAPGRRKVILPALANPNATQFVGTSMNMIDAGRDGTAGVLNTDALVISSRNNVIESRCAINVGDSGLAFMGEGNPAIDIAADPSAPATLKLGGDIVFAGASGVAAINGTGLPPQAGQLDLGGALRTFNVESAAASMRVSTNIIGGAIVKQGLGTLELSSPNAYAGGTTLATGTLIADAAGSLGSGTITFAGGALTVSTAGAAVSLPNTVVASPGASITLNVAGPGGAAQIGGLQVGSALNVQGDAAASLMVQGDVTVPPGSTPATVTINNIPAVTINGKISGPFGITKTLGGRLTFAGSSDNTYTGLTEVDDGTLELAKTNNAVAVPGDLAIVGPGAVVLGNSNQLTPTANINFNSVGGNAVLKLSGHTLTASKAQVTAVRGSLGPGGGTLILQNLIVPLNTSLDVADNSIELQYKVSSPARIIRAMLVSGYDQGKWDGPGLNTSLAAAGRALGYADSADGVVGGLPAGTVLIRSTLPGDANLDGLVDFSDLLILAQHYGQAAGAAWDKGDFNYDGTTDFKDLLSVAQHFKQRVAVIPLPVTPLPAAGPEGAVAVPEPATVWRILPLVLLYSVGRRRTAVEAPMLVGAADCPSGVRGVRGICCHAASIL